MKKLAAHRAIKSFARRQGRMTKGQCHALEKFSADYLLNCDSELDLHGTAIFPQLQPVIMEIGFGMGESLYANAKQFPQWNYLGVEVYQPGIGALLGHVAANNMTNLRVISADVLDVLQTALPDQSLAAVVLLFPDPWPKKRHHKRRLINESFLSLLLKKLQQGGQLLMVTDWQDYAQAIAQALANQPQFKRLQTGQLMPCLTQYAKNTKYQRKAQHAARNLHYFAAEKLSCF